MPLSQNQDGYGRTATTQDPGPQQRAVFLKLVKSAQSEIFLTPGPIISRHIWKQVCLEMPLAVATPGLLLGPWTHMPESQLDNTGPGRWHLLPKAWGVRSLSCGPSRAGQWDSLLSRSPSSSGTLPLSATGQSPAPLVLEHLSSLSGSLLNGFQTHKGGSVWEPCTWEWQSALFPFPRPN